MAQDLYSPVSSSLPFHSESHSPVGISPPNGKGDLGSYGSSLEVFKAQLHKALSSLGFYQKLFVFSAGGWTGDLWDPF